MAERPTTPTQPAPAGRGAPASSVDVSIIIVNWNSKDYVQQCLASIERETRGLQYEVVVIDSGSMDGCGEMLKALYPQVKFIQSQKNVGFARANNLAFQASQGRTVLFLNPDTEITEAAINTMYDWAHSLPQAGVVGCKLLNGDGTVQTSCVQAVPTILNQVVDSEVFRRWWPRSPLWGMAALFPEDEEERPVPVRVISGACQMMKRDVFERVGRFSEDYFMYAEDVDLCIKARRTGHRNYYVPDAGIIHFGGGSSGAAAGDFSTIMMRESLFRYFRKFRGGKYAAGYRVSMFLSGLIRLLFSLLFLPVSLVRGRMAAWRGTFRKWFAILRWSAYCAKRYH